MSRCESFLQVHPGKEERGDHVRFVRGTQCIARMSDAAQPDAVLLIRTVFARWVALQPTETIAAEPAELHCGPRTSSRSRLRCMCRLIIWQVLRVHAEKPRYNDRRNRDVC